jgi:hypothetical protein
MRSGSRGRHPHVEAKNLAHLYDLPLLDWDRIATRLDGG